MASIFTKIIRGDLPGRFLWKDDRAVAFLTIAPLKPGHALVVPVEEVDHWIALEPEVAGHLMQVAQAVGRAQQRAFDPLRIGLMIVGVEVPHVHLHVTPIDAIGDLNFAHAERNPDPAAMDAAAEKIRTELRALGHAEVVDA